ncbi:MULTISPECIES: Imm30 family immunity protein [unclassified Sphingomonas]|uniref:Imm30 family immunity protein n=1 Tax=unclassified Sphingomonas TaxID=196159 RepID=UPI0012E13D9D|nr:MULTISPECIES: Imm30 family immunity protein [unclassified Sphingomonas]
MNETYEQCLASLRCEIETDGGRPAIIDAAVNKLLAKGDERLTSDLLSFLTDNAEYDEGMFSLVHAAEACDDRTYVRALLAVFPGLVASSPRWASIVLMRVLNSPSAQAELVRQLRNAPNFAKEAMRAMCERINSVSPQFLSKTVPVTVAASE